MSDRLVSSMHTIVKKGWTDNAVSHNSDVINDTDLVIWIKNELRFALESLVDLEITRQPPGTDLDVIVEIVKDSDEYQKAHTNIQRKVDETIHKLKNRYQNASERSSDFNSMSSSASSQSVLFISREELSLLISEIRTDPTRTLHQLLRLSGDNSIEELFREELEDGLLHALDNNQTHQLALNFMARTIVNGNQNECRKAHSLLVRYVLQNTRISHDYELRLLNQFYVDLPFIWNRFGEDVVEDIIQKALQVITDDHIFVTFAMIDPQAQWFGSWTHTLQPRNIIARYLEQNDSLIQRSLHTLRIGLKI